MHHQTIVRKHSRLCHPACALTLIACCLASQGCGDLLKQPYPAKAYFGIETGNPDSAASSTDSAPAANHPPASPVMLVRAVRVNPPYDGLPLVYQVGPDRYAADYYVNWIADPSALLTGDLTNWLEAADLMSIVATGSAVRPDYILESDVTRLLVDRTDPAKPRAEIAARFFLIRQDSAATTLIFEYADSVEMPAQHDTPDDYAAAYGQAYRKLLEQLTAGLRSALPQQK
jgi:ABC-type uncharacterized transport system auxiliary subunit